MITRNRDFLSAVPTGEDVEALLREFAPVRGRMQEMREMYDGAHGITRRMYRAGQSQNRLVHDFPHYITTMAAGYLVGNPVEYDAPEEQADALKALLAAYRACAADSVDTELARAASIYGKGVELVFLDERARIRTVALDPRTAFTVYDDTVENAPLCGVRITDKHVEIYTQWECFTYAAEGTPRFLARTPCPFSEVPMVEYWNGEDERGDFEGVSTLIDAYDRLQSDRMNDKEQFVDALLVLTGCTMQKDEDGRTPGRQLREDKMLMLPDAQAHVEWLCKTLSETDTEVLKKSLAADIHKLSMVPDLSDARFSGYESGVAMRYKLLGLEQLTRIKERFFREALRRRMALFAPVLEIYGAPPLNCADVTMRFNRAIPTDVLEEAKAIAALQGILPDETLTKAALRGVTA